MAYQEKKGGGFRLRASFPVDTELMTKANRVCELDGVSMYKLCRLALEEHVAKRLNAAGTVAQGAAGVEVH